MVDPFERLSNIESSYNESSPLYKFSYEFQNIIQTTTSLESTSTYPVILKGYSDLKKRSEQQKNICNKIEGSLDALTLRLEKSFIKSRILEQKMLNILTKLRNSKLRSDLVQKNNYNFYNVELGNLTEIHTYEASGDLVKVLSKMRLVLQKLLEATRQEKSKK